MKISKKDQSFILLIISVLVVIYGIYSFFSFLFYNATFHNSSVGKLIISDPKSSKQEWLNVEREFSVSDLKGRVILLNFWNYTCKKCANVFSEIENLKQQYGNKLTIITVHCPKSEDQKDYSAVRKEVLKNGIDYPVLNDKNGAVRNNFEIGNFPSLVLLDIHGDIVQKFTEDEIYDEMKSVVKKTIKKFQHQINSDYLPISLEKHGFFNNALSFPTKIEYAPKFKYQSYDAPAIFITNFAESNIIVTSLLGEIITTIGQKGKGFADGDFDEAVFNFPQGLIYYDDKLYIADTGNHALRMVDFKTMKVTTLIGSGIFGDKLGLKAVDAEDFNLSYPTEIEFFPDKNNIAIANSGTGQILKYDTQSKKISALSEVTDNLLLGVSDMYSYGKNLYILNPEKSALLMMNGDGVLEVLADKNSLNSLSHPVALSVDDTGIYIVDSADQKIKKYDFASKKISNYLGSGKRGDNLGRGNATQFNEPSGIVSVLDRFYVSDTNNNRIILINRANLNSELLDVLPPLKLVKRTNLEYLPNLEREPSLELNFNQESKVKIILKDGWKINEMGPSFLSLLKFTSDNEVDLIGDFDWNIIQKKSITLPKLIDGEKYLLQGVIYYCEDKKNALCYVKSYERRLESDSDGVGEFDIKLGH